MFSNRIQVLNDPLELNRLARGGAVGFFVHLGCEDGPRLIDQTAHFHHIAHADGAERGALGNGAVVHAHRLPNDHQLRDEFVKRSDAFNRAFNVVVLDESRLNSCSTSPGRFVVEHFSLESRERMSRFQVLIDGVDEQGRIDTQDMQLHGLIGFCGIFFPIIKAKVKKKIPAGCFYSSEGNE